MYRLDPKHACLSGVFPEQPPSPPAEGNTIPKEGPGTLDDSLWRANTNVNAARAILAGTPLPDGHAYVSEWPTPFEERSRELATIPDEVTAALLFPDSPLEPGESPLPRIEEAIEEVFLGMDTGLQEEEVANAILRQEILLAQRRALERLVRLADEVAANLAK